MACRLLTVGDISAEQEADQECDHRPNHDKAGVAPAAARAAAIPVRLPTRAPLVQRGGCASTDAEGGAHCEEAHSTVHRLKREGCNTFLNVQEGRSGVF